MARQDKVFREKAIHYTNMENKLLPKMMYDNDEHFEIGPSIRTNIFMLTLFTRITDFGVLYGPAVNYRPALDENLLDREKFPISLVDAAYSEAAPFNIFAGNPFEILFYKEKKLENWDPDNYWALASCRLQSLALEHIKAGNHSRKKVQLRKTTVAVYPTRKDVMRLAYILNREVAIPKTTDPKNIYLDYHSLFFGFQTMYPRTEQDLKEIVRDKFNWPFFQFPEGKMLCEHMWRVRSFFQSMHSIGIGYIEGNHRAVLACKTLYGQKVNAAFPLHLPFQKRMEPTTEQKQQPVRKITSEEAKVTRTKDEEKFIDLPEKSPLFNCNLEVKAIIPWVDSKNAKNRVITETHLELCRDRSSNIAVQKQYVIPETWSGFIAATAKNIRDSYDYNPIDEEDLLRLQLPTHYTEWNEKKKCLTGKQYHMLTWLTKQRKQL